MHFNLEGGSLKPLFWFYNMICRQISRYTFFQTEKTPCKTAFGGLSVKTIAACAFDFEKKEQKISIIFGCLCPYIRLISSCIK